MKRKFKICSIILALAIALQMSLPVFAEETTDGTEDQQEVTETVDETTDGTTDEVTEETLDDSEEVKSDDAAEETDTQDDSEVVENADASYERYVALGADLSDSERAAVLNLLGLTEADLNSDYIVNYITNDDEYAYLSDYLSSDVIGSRALSSVKVVKTEEGSGITVSTHNISYCTSSMYTNALVTAGITDANVVVAGPFSISGTSALVGVMQSYEKMTGETLSDENKDAAVNELVLTGELSDELGDSDAAASLIADLKEKMANGELGSDEEIMSAIEESANELGISLTDQEKESILSLLKKFANLDWDPQTLVNQAQGIYNKLESMGVDTQSLFDKIVAFFQSILNMLKGNS